MRHEEWMEHDERKKQPDHDPVKLAAAAPDLAKLLSWCVATMRARIPEVLGSHPEGSQAAKLLADLGYQHPSAERTP